MPFEDDSDPTSRFADIYSRAGTLSLLSIDLRDKIAKKYFSSFGQILIIGTYMRCVCDCNPT